MICHQWCRLLVGKEFTVSKFPLKCIVCLGAHLIYCEKVPPIYFIFFVILIIDLNERLGIGDVPQISPMDDPNPSFYFIFIKGN